MRFSIYLFNDDIISFKDMVDQNTSNEYREINIKDDSSLKYCLNICKKCIIDCKLWVKRKNTITEWVNFFSSDFNIDNPSVDDISNLELPESFIFLIKVFFEDKYIYFGLTGGYGYTKLNKDNVKNDFGIKTALNIIDDEKIKQVDVRKLTSYGEQKLVFNGTGKGINQYVFDFDFFNEVLKTVSGKIDSDKVKKVGLEEFDINLNGKEQLNFSTSKLNLFNLGDKLKRFYSIYILEDYKKLYKFVDNFSAIKDSEIIESLNNELVENLSNNTTKVIFSYIDNKYFEGDYHFIFKSKKANVKSCKYEELNINNFYKWMDENKLTVNSYANLTDDYQVLFISEENKEPKLIIDLLVAEIDIEDKKCLLMDGTWYYIHKEYEDEINTKLQQNKDNNYCLPQVQIMTKRNKNNMLIDSLEDEGDYNVRIANKSRVKFDKEDYPYYGYKGTIEVCDIYDGENNYFIHIKFGTDASTLSHLFSQGVIAAQVIKEKEDCRNYISSKLENNFKPDYNNFIIVYAICPDCKTRAMYRIPEDLSIFNKINLCDSIDKLRRLGIKCKVLKINTD